MKTAVATDHEQGWDRALLAAAHRELGSIAPADDNLGDLAPERLAGSEVDRHTVPAPVLDLHPCRRIGLAPGVGFDALLDELKTQEKKRGQTNR